MCPQISYSINIPAVSYPGQLADGCQVKDVLSAAAFLAAMNYGTLAVTDEANTLGFDQLACKAPGLTTDISVMGAVLGVVLADQARAQNPAVPTAQYPQKSAVPCLRKGRIWVYAETAMTDGTNPFIRFGASVNGAVLGAFRNDADTVTAVDHAVQMPLGQAVVRGTTTGPGYCVIELDIV